MATPHNKLTGFTKFDGSKPMLTNMHEFLPELGEVHQIIEHGAAKYERGNWKRATTDDELARYTNAAMRHLFQSVSEEACQDSGFNHLAHCMCNLLFIMHIKRTQKEVNDDVVENDSHPTARIIGIGDGQSTTVFPESMSIIEASAATHARDLAISLTGGDVPADPQDPGVGTQDATFETAPAAGDFVSVTDTARSESVADVDWDLAISKVETLLRFAKEQAKKAKYVPELPLRAKGASRFQFPMGPSDA